MLKIEVGKTYYTDSAGTHFKVLDIQGDHFSYTIYNRDGSFYMYSNYTISGANRSKWKEYKEPVVHRNDVIWLKYIGSDVTYRKAGEIVSLFVGHKHDVQNVNYDKTCWSEVKRQTVEYTEE